MFEYFLITRIGIYIFRKRRLSLNLHIWCINICARLALSHLIFLGNSLMVLCLLTRALKNKQSNIARIFVVWPINSKCPQFIRVTFLKFEKTWHFKVLAQVQRKLTVLTFFAHMIKSVTDVVRFVYIIFYYRRTFRYEGCS